MKIGIDARFLTRDRRGMGRYVSSLLDALRARSTAHEIVLLHDEASARSRADLDLCWCPWSRADLTVPGIPVVVTMHDLAPITMPRPGWLRALDRQHDLRRLRSALVRADWIITVSEFIRREIVTRLERDPARVVAVHEGVSPAFFGAPEARRDGPLLWVGTDDERKNLPRLLEALARIRSRGREIQLVLCGDNPDLATRHRRWLDRLDPTAVVVTGYLSDADLMARYRAARLFVFPSLYEGFGLPVLEAMASGTAVACSSAAALPEVAGGAAEYFDPHDVDNMTAAIERCLEDDELCARLGARGRARAATFTWDGAADRMLHLFEQAACTTPA